MSEAMPMDLPAPAPAPARRATPHMLAAGAAGNFLEWYDFAAYGFLASIFAKNFFPNSSPLIGLLSAFGIFAASFLMRPLGAVLFGHIGDRYGRQRALFISAALMTVSTVAIGLLPTYAMVGTAAPVMLLVLRLAQGVSIGGEFTTSAVFLAENSAPRWRGLVSSFSTVGSNGGTLLGSGIGALTASFLTQDQLVDWGWRIPFLLGVVLGAFALLVRKSMAQDAGTAEAGDEPPMVRAFREDWRAILRANSMTFLVGVIFYLIFVYLTTYMQQVDHLSARVALQMNTANMMVTLILCVVFAALSDRIGRKWVLGAGFFGMIVFSWPLFRLLSSAVAEEVFLGQLGFAVLIALGGGTMPGTLVEMFARRTRCSAVAISWNLGIGIGGGTAPIVAVFLQEQLNSPMAPALYLIVLAAIALAGLLTMEDRAGLPLDREQRDAPSRRDPRNPLGNSQT
ncbi:MAG: MFS transporter [Rhizobiales bacterium 32-66-11]|nr:MAG: MFS transporter [Rhizobiales bacterium 32-66-11]